MQELFANNAISTLASSINSSVTSLTLATGTGALFPSISGSQFFRVSLTDALTRSNHEIMFCTAISGDTLTVTRGQEGTIAQSWAANDIIMNEITAGAMVQLYSPSNDQANVVRFAVDTGTANAYVIALNPSMPSSTISGGVPIVLFKALHANTGASTITINGGTTYNLIGLSGSALIGGEIQANAIVQIVFNGTSFSLLSATGTQTTNFKALTQNGNGVIDTSGYTSSLSIPGWRKDPDGFIMQWGVTSALTQLSSNTIGFPISFPNACLNVECTPYDPTTSATQDLLPKIVSLSTSSFVLYANVIGANTTATAFSWKAIGY